MINAIWNFLVDTFGFDVAAGIVYLGLPIVLLICVLWCMRVCRHYYEDRNN